MVKTGRHQFYPQTFIEYWFVQSTVLNIEVQSHMLSTFKKSGDKIMACTNMLREGSGMSDDSHIDVIEKLWYYLSLKKWVIPQDKSRKEVR